MNDEKFICKLKRAEGVMTVTVVVLCASLILRLADGDWLGSIACVVFLVVVYHYFKQTRVLSLLMHYINILETERTYNEKRIKHLDEECHTSEEIISNLRHIDANNCEIIEKQEEIIAYKNQIIKNYESATSEVACFIPSEGGGE